jgi:putative GTP pyrophosphokinase
MDEPTINESAVNYEQLVQDFENFHDSRVKIWERAAAKFREIILYTLKPRFHEDHVPQITSRIKQRDECIAKYNSKYQEKAVENQEIRPIESYITDIIGVRVICLYEDEVELIADLLRSSFDVIEETNKIQSIRSTEDRMGYQAWHMDLRLPENSRSMPERKPYMDIRFEVQIRTIIQDAWSTIDHKIKYKRNPSPETKRVINILSGLFELADRQFLVLRNKEQQAASSLPSVKVAQTLSLGDFSAFLAKNFPNTPLTEHFANKFLMSIKNLVPTLDMTELQRAYETHIAEVRQHEERVKGMEGGKGFSPFTILRHVLFIHNPQTFASMLSKKQKSALEQPGKK